MRMKADRTSEWCFAFYRNLVDLDAANAAGTAAAGALVAVAALPLPALLRCPAAPSAALTPRSDE